MVRAEALRSGQIFEMVSGTRSEMEITENSHVARPLSSNHPATSNRDAGGFRGWTVACRHVSAARLPPPRHRAGLGGHAASTMKDPRQIISLPRDFAHIASMRERYCPV